MTSNEEYCFLLHCMKTLCFTCVYFICSYFSLVALLTLSIHQTSAPVSFTHALPLIYSLQEHSQTYSPASLLCISILEPFFQHPQRVHPFEC